jgi:hypothetical protein
MKSIESASRRAGALYFVFMLVGLVDLYGFGGFIVPGNATATARNIMAAESTYRLGVLTDCLSLLLFVPLVVTLYNLLKDVDKWQAILMVLLVSVGVTVGFANVLNKMAPLVLLGGAEYLSVFTTPQLDALAQGFLNLNGVGSTIASAFWGLWLFPCGFLVIKSGLFPRVLGVLLLVAGFGLLTTSVTSIAFPAYERVVTRAMMPLGLGEFPFIFWLLVKGAKVRQPGVGTSAVV